jgi:putative DNA primase/helicase
MDILEVFETQQAKKEVVLTEEEKVIAENLDNKKESASLIQSMEAMRKRINIQNAVNKYFENGMFKADFMAECFLDKIKIATINGSGEMFHYDNTEGIYKPDAEFLIQEFCEKELPVIRTNNVNEVINHIKRRTYIKREKIGEDKFKIHLQNGIFDVRTMDISPFVPCIISMNKLPIIYDKEADCPKFKKFISEIVIPTDVPLIQEFFGYCLWKSYPIHKAFMLIGEGRNGKSTLLSVLHKVLGSNNVCAVSLQELEDRFATAYFYDKLANIYADIPTKSLVETGRFKMLTGEDCLMAERKNQMAFNFVNHAKMIFSCNKLPEVRDDTIAFFRRWIIINFPNKFNKGTANISLVEELSQPNEVSGIFNWAIEGLKRVLKNSEFSSDITPEQVAEIYKRMSNSLLAFVMDCLEVDCNNHLSKTEVYNAYVVYCQKNNIPCKTKDGVGKELGRHIPISETWQGRERNWMGIKFKVVQQVQQEQHRNHTPLFTPYFLHRDIDNGVVPVVIEQLNELLPENTPLFPMDNTSSIITKQDMRKKILDFMSLEQLSSYYDIEISCAGENIDTFFVVFQQLKKDGIIFEPTPERYSLVVK